MLKTRPSRALAKPCLDVTFSPETLTLSFSQPMIALGAELIPPLDIQPPVPGSWHWLDRCRLAFEPAAPLARATGYTISLPQGARSLEGHPVGPQSWQLVLPGPEIVVVTPAAGGRVNRQPVFRILFDQAVSPAQLLGRVRLWAGRRRVALSLADRSDPCQLALQPTRELPLDTRLLLEVPAGLPSAEGPRLSQKSRRFHFRTYAPLRMVRRGLLEWLSSPLTTEPLRIRFNNPIRVESARVKLEPELDVFLRVEGCDLLVCGRREPGQSYRVEVDPDLTDIYGQKLGQPERRSFRPGWVTPHLSLPTPMVAVRPGGKVPLYTAGFKRVNCRLKAVEPDQFGDYMRGLPLKSRPVRSWTQPVPNWGALETNWLEVGEEPGHRLLEVWAGHLVAVLWLQVTELNLQARTYPEGLSLIVTGPEGAPRQGATVQWGQLEGRTDEQGHCLLECSAPSNRVLARLGQDSAFLCLSVPWPRREQELRWCVFDDRGLYRPGETARVKGWLRRPRGGVPSGQVSYRLIGPEEERTGQALLSPQGGFDLELELTGPSTLELTCEDETCAHLFRVEEFRRPEFELDLAPLSEQPAYDFRQPPTLRLTAAYHAGGALGQAALRWSHVLFQARWVPPGWESFSFGTVPRDTLGEALHHGGALDEQGQALIPVPGREPVCGTAIRVVTSVEVTDLSRQVVATRAETTLVGAHPMIGLRPVADGAELIVVDPLGQPLAGHRVTLRCGEACWEVLSEAGPVAVSLPAATALEASLGEARAHFHPRRVTASTGIDLPAGPFEPGQVLPLRLRCPEPYKLGVVRLWAGPRRLLVRIFQPGEELELRLPETLERSLELEVGCLLENGVWKTHHTRLPLSLAGRELEVSLALDPERVRPGGTVEVEVEVRDRQGRPVPDAEVTLLAVDQAVLQAAGGHRLPDPLARFYPDLWSGATESSLANWFPRHSPPELDGSRDSAVCCMLGSDVAGGGIRSAVTLREDLRALAFFHPSLRTDAQGRVVVEASLPDSLSRYRVTALVGSGASFGSAETYLSTRLPLALRPWLPRFLHQGDRFDFCLSVQNLTAEEREVQVEVAVSGLTFLEGVERRCRVQPGARVEVRLPCRADRVSEAVGLARVVSGQLEDACRVRLPVSARLLPDRVVWQGRSGPTLRVEVPPDVELERGELELVECDGPLPLARPAYDALRRYPMNCSEQLASRLLGWALGGPLWSPDRWKAEAGQLVEQLLARQQADGQFWLFPGCSHSYPFVSVHATQALLRAYTAGVELDLARLSRAMDHLGQLPSGSPLEEAYALNVLSQVGRAPAERVEQLAGHRRLTVEGMAWLLPLTRGRTRARLREKLLDGLSRDPGPQGLFTSSRRPAALAMLALGEESGQLEALLEPNPYGSTQDHAFTMLALEAMGGSDREARSLGLRPLLEQPEVATRAEGFYRATLTTVPRELRREAVNQGFQVTRSYELGELVRIKIVIQTTLSHAMVGLIDPLPAGLELLPRSQQSGSGGLLHRDYRDDCTELCWERLPRGRHELTLLARATTPGRFFAPGIRVEEMYRPQVFGRGEAQELDL